MMRAEKYKELIKELRDENCTNCPNKGMYKSFGIKSLFRKVPICEHCSVEKRVRSYQKKIDEQRDGSLRYKY